MVAIYPGTFDPITFGHIDIIERASKLCEKLIVAVLINVTKRPYFTTEERKKHIETATKHLTNVEVVTFSGLLVELAEKTGADVVIKGLRNATEFDLEFAYAQGYKVLSPKLETLFIATNSKYCYLSSSMVRELAKFNGDLTQMVPKFIINEMKNIL